MSGIIGLDDISNFFRNHHINIKNKPVVVRRKGRMSKLDMASQELEQSKIYV